jgi:hypothetical protein
MAVVHLVGVEGMHEKMYMGRNARLRIDGRISGEGDGFHSVGLGHHVARL